MPLYGISRLKTTNLPSKISRTPLRRFWGLSRIDGEFLLSQAGLFSSGRQPIPAAADFLLGGEIKRGRSSFSYAPLQKTEEENPGSLTHAPDAMRPHVGRQAPECARPHTRARPAEIRPKISLDDRQDFRHNFLDIRLSLTTRSERSDSHQRPPFGCDLVSHGAASCGILRHQARFQANPGKRFKPPCNAMANIR